MRKSARGFVRLVGCRCTQVTMIDFAAFLRTRFKPEDWVVAKIDVEGSEYDLFDHLLATGAASLLDEIFVEVRAIAGRARA